MTGCANGSPEEDLTTTIEGVMAAANVEVDRNYIAGYARKSAPGCDEVPEDDRWYDIQTGQILSDRQTQARVYEGALAYLQDNGYEVRHYESAAFPDVDTLAVRGVKDDRVVRVTIGGDGNSHIRVTAGPCSVQVSEFAADRYRPVN